MNIQISTFADMPAGELSEFDRKLHTLGVMKTIYVPVHPKVNQIKSELSRAVEQTIGMFQDPHKRTQDRLHERFFETYRQWAKPSIYIESSDYPHQYPTNGSNEAIRESIAYFATQSRALNQVPRIHIFDGEYEGYSAHAETHEVEVVRHDRENFETSLTSKLRPGEPFYISQPSGIDGNIWDEFDRFCQFLSMNHSQTPVRLDLAYLNTTGNIPVFNTYLDIIDMIFVSMSKSFPGTYYDRIGGVFSRAPLPGLYGNKWFKNLNGLLLGVNLMENSPLGEIGQDMKLVQAEVIERLKVKFGSSLAASDVAFIATQPIPDKLTDIQKELIRAGRIRYCLTPSLIKALNA